MRSTDSRHAVLPLVEERATVRKNRVDTARVRIRTVLDERAQLVRETLERQDVSIERVPVEREVTEPPEWRREGDVLVIPLVEEVLVLEKRLVLREELRVRLQRGSEQYESNVNLKSTRAVVERTRAKQKPTARKRERAHAAQRSVQHRSAVHRPT